MGFQDGEYSEFKILNRWVIKEPLDEINDKSDLLVEAEYKKAGRRVVAVKFHIRPNPKHGTKVIEHLAPAEQRPPGRAGSSSARRTEDDFERWFNGQPEATRSDLRAKAIDLLTDLEKAEITSGKPTFTTQYQVEVNMRLLSREMRRPTAA
jgi:plasmid replication initiation protein